MNDNLGKQAEQKIREWLDKPETGYCFDRIYDQTSGFYGSRNISDFTLFKYPEFYYIESKATWEDNFQFARITETQREGLLKKAEIPHVHGLVIVLFASHKRAFIIDITSIPEVEANGSKSINIKKLDKWKDVGLRYAEIPTELNPRKKLLDYTGNIEELIQVITYIKPSEEIG